MKNSDYKIEYSLKEEQSEVLFHDDGDILVSASAGSGKTFVMVERIIRLIVEKKATVSEILAVTFTDAAANEMKERIKTALTKKISQTFDMNLIKQLSEISTADISTLHSFCGNLIRAYFFKLGLSPDFAICDEAQSSVLRTKALDKTFREFYDNKKEWFLSLVDQYAVARRDDELKKIILSLYLFANEEAEPIEFLKQSLSYYEKEQFDKLLQEYLSVFIERVSELKQQVCKTDESFIKLDNTKGAKFCTSLLCELEKALNTQNVYEVKRLKDFKLTKSMGTNLDEVQEKLRYSAVTCYDDFVDLILDYDKHLTAYQTDLDSLASLKEQTEGLINITQRFTENYDALKREENLLDFGDMSHFALQLLLDDEIRPIIKNKYKFVFVDEYQDVNSIQEQIVSLVSSDNLFMVGDEKQSIYGFRGCRPEIFTQKFSKMQNNGQKAVLLNYNFRSANAILDMANQIFGFAMTKKNFEKPYLPDAKLVTGGGYPSNAEGRATLHHLKINTAKKKKEKEEITHIYDILEHLQQEDSQEDNLTASLLTKIINLELGNTYYNAKLKKEVPITYKDIVILSRKKSGKPLARIVRGLLRHGIPVSSEVVDNVCDYPEVDVLINLIKLIDCFYQDLPLVVTLKSVIGGFTEEELFEISEYSKNQTGHKLCFSEAYEYYVQNADTPLSVKLKEFNAYIQKLRLLADFVGVHGILTKVIADKNIEAKLYARPNGRLEVARVNAFVGASLCATGSSYTTKEFLEMVQTSPESFKMTECAEEETVRLMTIHSSKGLEFPVVIVIGLETPLSKKSEQASVYIDRQMGIAVKNCNQSTRRKSETLLRGVMKQKMRKDRIKEELRLFYVATTRATYSMHLVAVGKGDYREDEFTSADSFMGYLPASLPVQVHYQSEFNFVNMRKQVRKVLIGKKDEQVENAMKENFAFNYPYNEDTYLPLKNTVTGLNKLDNEQGVILTLFDEELDGGTSIESGTIAHKVLELYDFHSKEGLEKQVQKMIDSGHISKTDLGKIDISRIEKAISNEIFIDIGNAELLKEKNFLINIPANEILPFSTKTSVLVQGVIDLLVLKNDNTAEIIDYKYSVLSIDSLKVKYKKQLDLYAYAVQKVLGRKVTKKVLVNIFTGQSVIVD